MTPINGWFCWVEDEKDIYVYDTTWGTFGSSLGAVQNLSLLGVNTTADITNKLAVASEAVLFTNTGNNVQLKLNKATPGDTASLLFQSSWSGRAEMGLAGNDDFSVKVSADGAAWNTGLALDAATGKVTMPLGAVVTGSITGTAITQSTTDATAGRLLRVGDFGLGSAACPIITDFTVELAAGLYRYSEDTVVGGPDSVSYWSSAIVTRQQDGGTSVLAIRRAVGAAPKLWIGHRAGATGALAWTEIYHQKNILGTVSQSAGVPTGAVIERGANANGEYAKFADGTLICTASGRTLAYSTADLINYTWTFPAPCVVGSFPVVSAALSPLTADYAGLARRDLCAFAQSAGTAGAVVSFTRPSGATRAFIAGDAAANVRLVVTGRWF